MAEEKYTIELKINDEVMPVNDFVQSFFANTILGSLKSLRDIPDDIKNVSLSITKE